MDTFDISAVHGLTFPWAVKRNGVTFISLHETYHDAEIFAAAKTVEAARAAKLAEPAQGTMTGRWSGAATHITNGPRPRL